MPNNLFEHQRLAVEKLKTGSILVGGVGSGKSRTALAYFITKECGGKLGDIKLKHRKDLYIITTARKRDTLEWERECALFLITNKPDIGIATVKVDSWNNIGKYTNIENAFFIFDEQRVVGYGAWTKSFLKITKTNNWILLSATPGDTWMDYLPVFIANGFYKNKTEFTRRHVVYSRFCKFPKVDKYVDCGRLIKFRREITVDMFFERHTVAHNKTITVGHNKVLVDQVMKDRWDPFKNEPVTDAGNLCYLLRKIVNSDTRRLDAICELTKEHPKIIIFYNFNYELEMLRDLGRDLEIRTAEWNGHKHEPIPNTDKWLYFVQYTAGAEGWNCIETNVIVFFSQNYSYKIMTQAAGRIDRLNTPYKDLYYYHLRSNAKIDLAIKRALSNKRDFNMRNFASRKKHML